MTLKLATVDLLEIPFLVNTLIPRKKKLCEPLPCGLAITRALHAINTCTILLYRIVVWCCNRIVFAQSGNLAERRQRKYFIAPPTCISSENVEVFVASLACALSRQINRIVGVTNSCVHVEIKQESNLICVHGLNHMHRDARPLPRHARRFHMFSSQTCTGIQLTGRCFASLWEQTPVNMCRGHSYLTSFETRLRLDKSRGWFSSDSTAVRLTSAERNRKNVRLLQDD